MQQGLRERMGFSVKEFSVLHFNSMSNSGAEPGRTSAARKRLCSIRLKAIAANRATSHRSPQKRACSASPPWSTTSRRSPIFPTSYLEEALHSRASAPSTHRDRDYFVCRDTSSVRAFTRFPLAPRCVNSSISQAGLEAQGDSKRYCWAARLGLLFHQANWTHR